MLKRIYKNVNEKKLKKRHKLFQNKDFRKVVTKKTVNFYKRVYMVPLVNVILTF